MEPSDRLGFGGTERFEIVRRLGAGGMGVVYEAFDRELESRVALKTLRSLDANGRYRMKREFRLLREVRHPNLVALGELIEESGRLFFTMDLVDGVDMLTYVRGDADERGFNESRLRVALGQLATGLVALHEAGKVHRDVKPSNVLVTEAGQLALVDFGLSCDIDDERQSTEGQGMGTALYMAPEQAMGDSVRASSVWYAVGVILYVAMTGKLPFSGPPLQVLMDKQQHVPAPPRALIPDVPADLDALCVELLEFAPSARPEGRKLLRRLGVEDTLIAASTTTSQFVQAPPFVGREDELSSLEQAFAESQRRSLAVLVQGHSGLGKSALIRRFTEHAVAAGDDVVVLHGKCHEHESLPYTALDPIIDALSAFMRRMTTVEAGRLLPRNASLLPRVFPVLGRVEVIAKAPLPKNQPKEPLEVRRRVFDSVRDLLVKLAERSPVIIAIDDMQWADGDSRQLLDHVMTPPTAPPLLLLLTQRSDPGNSWRPPGDSRILELEPLHDLAARRLAKLLLKSAGLHRVVSPGMIAGEASGHPLYIAELVRHQAAVGDQSERPRLDDAIIARVTRLPAAARRILELVAVATRPLAQEIIRKASQLEPDSFAKQLALMRVANLVRSGGVRASDPIEPYHDRVREAVLAHLDDARRTATHARLALALETAGASPEVLLGHFEASGQYQRAAKYAERSAERAVDTLAYERAADLYNVALELGGCGGGSSAGAGGAKIELGADDETQQRELRRRLAEALVNAGRGADAAESYVAAAQGADSSTRLDCYRLAAEQWLISGHIERGLEALASLLGEIGVTMPATPRRALVSLLWHRARLRLRGLGWREKHESQITRECLTRLDVYRAVGQGLAMVDNVRGADFQVRGLLLALRTGERRRVAQCILLEAGFLATQGQRGRRRAWRLIDRARPIVESENDAFLAAYFDTTIAVVEYLEGRFPVAAELSLRGERRFLDETRGAAWALNVARLVRLFALRHKGAMRELSTATDSYLRDARRRGDLYMATTVTRLGNRRWLVRDDLEGATADLAGSSWVPAGKGFHLQHWYELEARAELALYAGRSEIALEELQPSFDGLLGSLLTRIQIIRALSRWLRARLLLGVAERGGAERAAPLLGEVGRLAGKLEREHIGYADAWAALLRAGIAACGGRHEDAVAHLDRALRRSEELGMELCAISAGFWRGTVIGGDEGQELVAAAEAWMKREEVASPEHLIRIVAPGFAGVDATGSD